MRQRVFVVLLVAIFVLAASGVARSQTVQGVITGTVTDPTGAVVPKATVTITNVGTNISQTETTGDDGSYRFPLVPPGAYTIVVKAANFAEVRTSGIVVEASQTIPFNVKLQLAKASEIIEVTSQAPLVQTATSDLGMQVDSSTIQNAALVDRDVFATLPFMATQVAPGIDMSPASGGARESGTSYMLNGADDNNNFSEGAINTSPPLESVEDFSIITNSMSAQYGRGAGAVVSANQKSGTNAFHGALYEQNRNATLNANDFFYNRDFPGQGRPKYIKNQFGGAGGGPIRKDKTFFFVAVDRYKLLQGTTSANNFVPTSAALAYVKAHGSPIGLSVLSQYNPVTADASCPGQGDYIETPATGPSIDTGIKTTGAGTNPFTGLPNTVGCLSFTDPVTTSQNVYFGRVDHNFSASDRLSFTANITRYSQTDEFGGGSILTSGPISGLTTLNAHNLAAIETHTFNPRLFNEINLSHNRFYNPFVEGNPAKQNAPEIIIDNRNVGGLCYVFGPFEGGQIESFVQDRWGLQDNLTYTLGRHSVRIGGSGSYGILYRNWDLGQPGYYEFGNLYSVTAPANAVTGLPAPCAATASCPVITPASDGTLQSDGTITGISNLSNTSFTSDYPYFQETSINPATGAKADSYRHYTYHDYAAFVQDDWKFNQHLTLNLGLRWERFGAPSEDHGNLAQFTNLNCNFLVASCIANARVNPVGRMWNTRNGDVGPRAGFAWDPFGGGKTAVRGSYGIYYDRIFDNIWSNGAWNPPFYALIDFAGNSGDNINYANPDSIGAGYNPANPIPRPGKRVSVRTMDVNMKDSSGQNFYLSVEHQFFGGLLLRAGYQGSFGRHLAMLENYNREDGIGYDSSLTSVRPNHLYSGFNYRSNSVSSSYNSLVLEAQKRMGHGLQFQTGFTWSKLLDTNSELFAGCSTIGGQTAPYYYTSNAFPRLNYGPGAEDHKYSYKFNVTYELPFLKSEKGFVGHALGGWSLGSFYQMYAGHPIDVHDGRPSYVARDANTTLPCATEAGNPVDPAGCPVLDPNGVPYNIGGDYNLDNVLNKHPNFTGSGSIYSGGNPANGIFTNINVIGCGFPGMPANIANIAQCNSDNGVGTAPNSLFSAPGYPTSGPLYERFGTLARDVFRGPRFQQLDLSLSKTFKLTERMNLRFSAQAQNLANHPNFDCVTSNLGSGNFGKAQCLVGTASRVMALNARLGF